MAETNHNAQRNGYHCGQQKPRHHGHQTGSNLVEERGFAGVVPNLRDVVGILCQLFSVSLFLPLIEGSGLVALLPVFGIEIA